MLTMPTLDPEAFYCHILESIPCSAHDRRVLDEALREVPFQRGVRQVMGFLIADTYRQSHPDVHADGQRFLDQVTYAPFSFTPLRIAIAYTSFFGASIYRNVSLREATNQVIEDTLVGQRDSPFVQTFLKVPDGSWTQFVLEYRLMGPLLSNMAANNIEVQGPKCVALRYDRRYARALSYVTVGMLRGLMKLFDAEGEVQTQHLDADSLVNEVRWH